MDELSDESIREKSIDELQALVSKYETESFAGFFAHFIKRPANSIDDQDLRMFESKLKQFLYLIALNVFSGVSGAAKLEAREKDIRKMGELVREITSFYKPEAVTDYSRESILHELAMRNHFDNGVLSYVEQDLEKIKRVFDPYEEFIKDRFGFDLTFLTQVYKEIELISAIRIKQLTGFMQAEEYHTFRKALMDNKSNFEEQFNRLPEEIQQSYLAFNTKPYAHLVFTARDLYARLPKEQVDAFLDLFSLEAKHDPLVRYYTSENPFDRKPILRLANEQYLNICQKQIPVAVYKWLYRELSGEIRFKDKLRQHRERSLEKKVVAIFKSFFSKRNTFFYENYSIDPNYEQDLLIIYKSIAIIIEVKASGLREPFRSSDKAIPRLQSDFKEAVQYGFDQCVRVEDHFYGSDPFDVKDKKGQRCFTVRPERIRNVYSIVVTLERFGSLQTDLHLLLEKDEAVDYPWSVYIDDLEIFLSALKQSENNHEGKLIEFLESRRLLHGKSHAIDELDVCAYFMRDTERFKKCAISEDTFFKFSPYEQGLFDEMYFSGSLRFQERPFPDEFYTFGI